MTEWLSSMGPAVGNHLWQSTAFAAVVWLATLLLRRNQARVRYVLWLAASVKFLIPFSLLVGLGSLLPKPQHVAVAMPVSYAVDTVAQPFTETPMDFAPVVVQASPMQRFEHMVPLALGIVWLSGVMVVLAVWGVRWRQVAKTLRQAVLVENGREWEILRRLHKAMGAGRQVPLLISQKLMEPGMFGIFRPVLIWPERLSERLDDEHIEAILAHELRHARRKDNLTAVIHMMVEAAFWFYPLVWWMERRMVEERERACDEAVVEMGSRPGVYAESLLKACRFCVESPLTCVSGITGADLSKRILSIMTLRLERMGVGKKAALALFGFLVIATPILLGQSEAAQRMMLAAANAAPRPFRAAAHAMIAEEQTPSTALIAEVQAGSAPIETANPTGDDKTAVNGTPAYVPTMTFDVASVRQSKLDLNLPHKVGGGFSPNSTNLRLENVQIYILLSMAYGVHDHQLEGLPDWGSTSYNIQAKSDSAADEKLAKLSDKDAQAEKEHMMQALLAERFKLKVHWETRKGPVYDLVVAKGGSKLHASGSMPPSADELKRFGDTKIPDIYQRGDGSRGYELIGHDCHIASLLGILSALMRTGVLDTTGLTGTYDFDLQYSQSPDSEREVDPTIWPPIPDAVQDQLGLKLVPAKGQVQVLVVDHVEKPTSVDGAEAQAVSPIPMPVSLVQEKNGASSGASQSASTDVPTSFEVASVRQAAPPGSQATTSGGARRITGAAIVTVTITLKLLLMRAYDLGPFQISGPAWIDSERYDIVAKIPEGAPKEEVPVMLQNLLAERFRMTLHTETKEYSGYILGIGKGGPKLIPAKNPNPASTGGFTIKDNLAVMNFNGATMLAFADDLSRTLQRPVIDSTGLADKFDIALPVSMGVIMPRAQETGADGSPVESDSSMSSLFTAIHDLGLKLDSGKVPLKCIVVDKAEKIPTEN
jgi:uncharacterized protein (TIGR03435 family)